MERLNAQFQAGEAVARTSESLQVVEALERVQEHVERVEAKLNERLSEVTRGAPPINKEKELVAGMNAPLFSRLHRNTIAIDMVLDRIDDLIVRLET